MDTPLSHILYIDDEMENLSGFKYAFRKHYQVHIAQNAEDAWKILHENPIKVLISDQRMPQISGVQILEKAAIEFPKAFRIVVTGYTEVQDIIAAINKGRIFQFIRKPWEKDEVKVILDNAIRLYDLKQENCKLLDDLKSKNKELSQLNENLEIIVKERTSELQMHKENLESLVKERTRELEIAKIKAEESDALKSAFLSNVSHEIRTPMNAIIGFSELLVSDNSLSDEEREEFKNQIVLNSNSLLRLIDDIIDISRIEANQVSIEYESHSLNQILGEIHTIFHEQKAGMDKSHLKLYADILPQYSPVILTDKIRLHQILSNLIGNALKFTEQGHVCYGYRLEQTGTTKPLIHFFVKDTGIGIDKEAQEYIFDRFRKAELKNKIFRGAGLGLFISKNLVEKFGGKIWLESEPGKGTGLHFEIPYLESQTLQQNLPLSQESQQKQYTFPDKTILVAEDEDSSYIYIHTILKDTQATILRAKNGLEAVNVIFNHPQKIDLVLMDIQMPEMNGYEAISIIKNHNHRIPIIAQTAHALISQQQDVIDSGCDHFLAKPYQKIDLLSSVGKFLCS
ncbi:MAG: response regulator [Bacteroidota bacterium]|nr:MAG: response regulator [Bacteroidota bacterium]